MTVEKPAARLLEIEKESNGYRHRVYIFKEKKVYTWVQSTPSASLREYLLNFSKFKNSGEVEVDSTELKDKRIRRDALEKLALKEVPALRDKNWVSLFSDKDLENKVWRDRTFLSDLGIIEDYYDY